MNETLRFAVCVKRYYIDYIDGNKTTVDYMKLGQIGEVKSKNHLSILGTVMATDVIFSHLRFFDTLAEAEVFSAEVKKCVETLESLLGATIDI